MSARMELDHGLDMLAKAREALFMSWQNLDEEFRAKCVLEALTLVHLAEQAIATAVGALPDGGSGPTEISEMASSLAGRRPS
jgi:hypothetical protein